MQPTFNKCETHKYGQFKSDKYCYCKETFCNHSTAVLPNIYCLGEQHQPRISPSLGGKRDIIKWNYITLGSCQVVVFITLHKLSNIFFCNWLTDKYKVKFDVELLLQLSHTQCTSPSTVILVRRSDHSQDDRDWCEAKILLI